MNCLNSILIEGMILENAKIDTTPTGATLARFQVRVERFLKENDGVTKEVSEFCVEAWGRLADNTKDKLNKGQALRAVGRLKQHRWEDETGTHSMVVILAEHIEFKPGRMKTNEQLEEEIEDDSEA